MSARQLSENLLTRIADRSNHTLLPPHLEDVRLNTYVYEMPVAGKATTNSGQGYEKIAASNEYEALRSTVLGDTHIADLRAEYEVALVDKLIPHSQFDMMLVDCGERFYSTPFQFGPETALACFSVAADFARYSKDLGLTPIACYNYDPHTHDRKSGMSMKRAHMHLIARTPAELAQMREGRKRLRDVNGAVKRRGFVDEAAVLGTMILQDTVEREWRDAMINRKPKKLLPFPRFTYRDCSNFIVPLPNGWDDLRDPVIIKELESFAYDVTFWYRLIAKLNLVGSINYLVLNDQKWKRKRPDNVHPMMRARTILDDTLRYKGFSLESKAALIYYLNALKPEILDIVGMDFIKAHPKSKFVSHVYPLGGPCYAFSIVEDEETVYVSIRPQVFGETGAAGLTFVDGTQLKLKRGSSVYTPDEERDKAEFQRSFVRKYQHRFFK